MIEAKVIETSDNLSYYATRLALLKRGYKEESNFEDKCEVFLKLGKRIILTKN